MATRGLKRAELVLEFRRARAGQIRETRGEKRERAAEARGAARLSASRPSARPGNPPGAGGPFLPDMEECKISVWVCREEKLISGLTRKTTCADVVKVLLEDQSLQSHQRHQDPQHPQDPQGVSAPVLSGGPHSYCIVEKWRGFERILPDKTKILRLWSAWGDEQENVRFVLVRHEASLCSAGPRSAEARVVASRDGPSARWWGPPRPTATLCQEKQRRIVRKAFRKLDRINRRREETSSKDPTAIEKMETLVHLVLSQDHTIRQQIQRIKELDREIEKYEAKVHFDRMRRHGINYVQDTYLDSGSGMSRTKGGEEPCPAELLAQIEEYASRCEEVVRLQEELAEHQALVDTITVEIQEELNRRWMKRHQEELSSRDSEIGAVKVTNVSPKLEKEALTSGAEMSPQAEFLLEEERIRTQLDTSLYVGLRLNSDLEAIENNLDLSQELWAAKEKELRDLLEKVDSLDLEDPGASQEGRESLSLAPSSKAKRGWTEESRGANDEDSDTGLSSMHSQDSDSVAVCESLV
ncbi:ras association domain-containing protein 10-like [Arapaima gigas]